MNIKELRNKSADELRAHLTELHKESFSLRMQKATGQLATTHQAKLVRREIARVNTLLTEKK
ncbi:50S ribosomal protein L29 [Luteimonas sp. FXH3W]|jgi:large subunit ribosomal protein L29|uniref:Large ribosomal subunit protein uL29 n=1 Tax=Aquilutibacter rugosus TaxID=3115820 RepID=A0ABU7UYS7_9GAMM